MTTFLDDEIGRVPGESVIPTDTAAILAANPAWTLTGDVWETVATEDVAVLDWGTPAPVTPRMGYVLTVELQTDQPAEVRWLIHQTYYDGGTLTLADGAANIDARTPVAAGAWVAIARAWDAPEGIASGSFVTEVTAPVGTLIQLRAPVAAPLDGPLVVRQVVAGNPAGARVVLAGDSLTAYDSTGTETARITGEEGVFVGGEFRTSDTLPGQVKLSDTAYVDSISGITRPGLSVTPVDTSQMATPPGVGAVGDAMLINGGRDIHGVRSHTAFSPRALYQASTAADGGSGESAVTPTYSMLRTTAPDGSSAQLFATMGMGDIRVTNAAGEVVSRVLADETEAYLYTRAGGRGRFLTVDASGIWVKSERLDGSGYWDHYNLEETANDTGWSSFPLNSTVTQSNSPGYRIKGGVVWLRGTLTLSTDWPSGWTVLGTLPTVARPSTGMQRPGASRATSGIVLQVNTAGVLEMYLPASMPGSTTIQLAPMFYPLG